MENQLSIINERGTLTQYLVASDVEAIVPEKVMSTPIRNQMAQCYFSEVLNLGIKSAVPILRVGRVFLVDVTPVEIKDPPLPYCPGVNLVQFYGVVSEYLSRWSRWGNQEIVQPYITGWLAGIDAAAHDVVRSANGLERDELGFLLLQLYRWKNVIRGGSF